MADLTILHTNDAHNFFRQRWAERLRGIKEATSPVLLLDAGDAVGSGNISWKPWGEGALRWMSWAGYDAMSLGNREFHVWRWALQSKIKHASFPVLCANLYARDGREVGIERTCIVELPNGLRIGLFGLLVEMVLPTAPIARISHFVFQSPHQVALRIVPRLKARVDVVICLSHLGLEQDRHLAKSVEGLDLIVGGHSHTPLEQPERRGSVWIAQAAPYLQSFGRIDMSVENHQIHQLQGRLLALRRSGAI